jgi:hypothetical protein
MVCTVVRLVVARSQVFPMAGNRSNSCHPAGKVLSPLGVGMGRVAYLWQSLQACEPHTVTPSRCCWDTRIRRSLTVAPVGSHIC